MISTHKCNEKLFAIEIVTSKNGCAKAHLKNHDCQIFATDFWNRNLAYPGLFLLTPYSQNLMATIAKFVTYKIHQLF